MEQNLTIFNFENKEVRTVKIDENIYFIASDVCKVLEHSNPSMALSRLDEDEKGISNVYTPGGNQEVLLVNESGLYSLVLTSRKPEAKRFKKWITSEVIPSIRKTGGYSVNGRTLTDRQILEMFMDLKKEFINLSSNVVALLNNNTIKNETSIEQPKYFQPSEKKDDNKINAHLYHRIVAYGKKFRPDVDQSTVRERAMEIGQMASRLSKEKRIPIIKEDNLDSRFPGKISYYHESVLKEVFGLLF